MPQIKPFLNLAKKMGATKSKNRFKETYAIPRECDASVEAAFNRPSFVSMPERAKQSMIASGQCDSGQPEQT